MFRKVICFLFHICFFFSVSNAQTFVERHLDRGVGSAIIESEDHNLIATVNLDNAGYFQVMKIDTSGLPLWSINVGPGTGHFPNNVAADIIKGSLNQYLIIGTYDPGIGGYNKVYAVLIDSAGNLLWENQYSTSNSGGSSAVYDSVNSVFYIIGGAFNVNQDIYLAKINTYGLVLWEKYFDYGADEFACQIAIRNDTDIWIIGSTAAYSLNHSTFDGLIINIDSSGYENWIQHYGGYHHEDFRKILLLDNGAIILGGTISYGAGNNDVWILRTNENGDTTWTKTFGYATGDACTDITYNGSNQDIWVVGYSYRGPAMLQDGWVFKMDTSGNVLYSTFLGGVANDQLYGTCYSNSNNSLFAMGSTYAGGVDSVYLVRLDSVNSITPVVFPEVGTRLLAFPNPANKQVYLLLPENYSKSNPEIELIDASGRKFHPDYTIEFDRLSIELPYDKGLYLIVLTINDRKYFCKLLKN